MGKLVRRDQIIYWNDRAAPGIFQRPDTAPEILDIGALLGGCRGLKGRDQGVGGLQDSFNLDIGVLFWYMAMVSSIHF